METETTTELLTVEQITAELIQQTRRRIQQFARGGSSVPLTPPMEAVFNTVLRKEYERDYIIQAGMNGMLYFTPKRLG